MSNLPPREPPDLRGNRGMNSPQRPDNSSNQQYPPQGQEAHPPQQPAPQRPQQGGLPPQQPPRLRNEPERYEPAPRRDFDDSSPARLGAEGGSSFDDSLRERRIEYLAWGSVVLGAGLCIILLAIDYEATSDLIFVMAPLLGGLILIASGFLQRVVFGYHVSILTWGTGIVALGFGITSFIAQVATETTLFTQGLIFIGLLIVLIGLVIIGQVFSRPTR